VQIRSLLVSSSFRLALLYMALSVGSVVILLGFLYWATAGYMDRQTDATIEAEITGLAEQYRQRGLSGLTAVLAERVARDPTGASVYLLVDKELAPIVGNLNRWPDSVFAEDGWVSFRLREWGLDRTDEHLARARTFLLRGGLHLLVGRDVRDLEATRELILKALGSGLAIMIGLALGGGLMMSAGMARRLEAINQTSREIMEGDLSQRVPTKGTGDDFDQLAVNLNRMLERIGALMSSVRQVSDNIAHDLRTPLTRLRTKLELANAETGAPEPLRAAVEGAIADAEELLATFNALLRIARIESGGSTAGFCAVDLARLVEDVADLYEPLAAERAQRFEVVADTTAPVRGDRDLLFQAAANLVDNAIKYTPEGGRIQVSVTQAAGEVGLQVADSGPGVPAEMHEKVLERFFRLDDSRTTPGNGLGLSLVKAVVDLHGGGLRLGDNEPGLRVGIWLPALGLPSVKS
jgi:signal transduction histidine kinase